MYGGAVGGGKTDSLIMLPLYRVEHPKHRCLMLRRTRPQLQEVIDRMQQLYPEIVPGAVWKEAESRWRFPSGAIIQLGYAEHEKDILNFKTFEYDLICVDELTSFTKYQYLFLFLRNRTKSADLPPLMRSATNPGDVGHAWVYERFLDKKLPYVIYDDTVEVEGQQLSIPRQFIPSRIWDNPALPNREAYIAGIMQMSPEDQAAYLYGDWSQLAGAMFQAMLIAPKNELADRDYFLVRTIDFGIVDPTCVLWLAHYPKSGMTDVVSELYLRGTTLDEVAKAVKLRESQMKLRMPVYSVGSPEMQAKQATSNQSIATMLATQGVTVDKGNIDIPAGLSRIRTLQQRGALRAWPGGDSEGIWGAPNLCRTLPMLQRDTGINKDPNRLRPRQEDHPVDSLRYGVMAIYESAEVVIKPEPVPEDPNRDYTFDKMMAELRKPKGSLYLPDLGNWNF